MREGEATITEWLKSVGDSIVADEILFIAENEKASLEVPAPVSGVLLEIVAHEGEAVPLTTTVAWLGEPGESIGTYDRLGSAVSARVRTASIEANTDQAESWVKATPLARRLAKAHSVDLRQVRGTGPGGRVKQADVDRALAEREPLATPTQQEASLAAIQPLTTVHRMMARRMADSFGAAPHFYLQLDLVATQLVELRDQLLSEIESRIGVRVTYTDFLLSAVSRLLTRHPHLNATWADEQIQAFRDVNVGIAVSGPQGLLVPVVHNADRLSLEQLVVKRWELAELAREKRLAPENLQGGTFTLTNLGMYGIDRFLPILNPPQSGILAAGSIRERPVGESGQVVLRPTLNLTLAADHRVVDGVMAARFLQDLRELLQAPARLLLA
jgi:pyruvate dehydrogenase E2 component (dihydrolipoamide acetyltransferase)